MQLIVRRVRPTPGSQLALLVLHDYHAFITDRDGETLALEGDHRRHAEVENSIRDLKYGVGLNHLPSGRFSANGAWLAVQVVAHNLARWTARLGLATGIVTTKTLRRRLFGLVGRLTRSVAGSPSTCRRAGRGRSVGRHCSPSSARSRCWPDLVRRRSCRSMAGGSLLTIALRCIPQGHIRSDRHLASSVGRRSQSNDALAAAPRRGGSGGRANGLVAPPSEAATRPVVNLKTGRRRAGACRLARQWKSMARVRAAATSRSVPTGRPRLLAVFTTRWIMLTC